MKVDNNYIVTGEFEKGNTEVEVADLCIAVGSSLTVTPAADLPEVDHIIRSIVPVTHGPLYYCRESLNVASVWS